MSDIKEVLKEICKEIIEQNNKPFEESEGGISNHIFDEKGVQMKIGWNLIKYLELEKDKKLNLQFEKKFFNKKLDKKDYLDIYFFHKEKKIGIEIKFKTKGFTSDAKFSDTENYKRNKHFKHFFSNQGASTNGKHSFFWDLHRLNNFIELGEIDEGYQIFITNDYYYWSEKERNTDLEFVLEHKGTNISLKPRKNNSDKFEMTHQTKIVKYGMVRPNWLSLDGIKGPTNEERKQLSEEKQRELYEKNLTKKIKEKNFMYSAEEIMLNNVVDEKILWMPESVCHNETSYANPAISSDDLERKETFKNIPDEEYKKNKLVMTNLKDQKKEKRNIGFPKFAFVIVELKKTN